MDVEKPSDDAKAGKGTDKGHGKSFKMRILGRSRQEGEHESTDDTLAAAETRQSAGPVALTELNKSDHLIASEKKRRSDPLLVFDENRIEIQDPPEEYTADTLGEKFSDTYRWIVTNEVVSPPPIISDS